MSDIAEYVVVLLLIVAGFFAVRRDMRRRAAEEERQEAERVLKANANHAIATHIMDYMGDDEVDRRLGRNFGDLAQGLVFFNQIIEKRGEKITRHLEDYTEDGEFQTEEFIVYMDSVIYDEGESDREGDIMFWEDERIGHHGPPRIPVRLTYTYVFRVWEPLKRGSFLEYITAGFEAEAFQTMRRRYPPPRYAWMFYRENAL